MEDGKWEEANKTKIFIEDKQRAARKRRESEAEESRKRGRNFFLQLLQI
jgi:hypothetical protein